MEKAYIRDATTAEAETDESFVISAKQKPAYIDKAYIRDATTAEAETDESFVVSAKQKPAYIDKAYIRNATTAEAETDESFVVSAKQTPAYIKTPAKLRDATSAEIKAGDSFDVLLDFNQGVPKNGTVNCDYYDYTKSSAKTYNPVDDDDAILSTVFVKTSSFGTTTGTFKSVSRTLYKSYSESSFSKKSSYDEGYYKVYKSIGDAGYKTEPYVKTRSCVIEPAVLQPEDYACTTKILNQAVLHPEDYACTTKILNQAVLHPEEYDCTTKILNQAVLHPETVISYTYTPSATTTADVTCYKSDGTSK